MTPAPKKNIMINIETLSTRSHATILIIGAIKFSFDDPISKNFDEKELDFFYKRISIESCIEKKMHIDEETKKWWKKQPQEVQFEALLNQDRIKIKDALIQFSNWLKIEKKSCVWGNGSDFDIAILSEAYIRCGLNIPWKFWMARDVRTVVHIFKKLCPNIYINLPQLHKDNALYDCHRQIFIIQKAFNFIKNINK